MHIKQIDETVVKKIGEGCEKAFSMLYQAYYVYLNAICFYYLNDENASREVVNDVFLNVWQRRKNLSFPIHSYLLRSVQNGAVDYLRTRQSTRRKLEGHREQFLLSYEENYIRATPEPLQYVELRDVEEKIKKTVEQMPPRCREIFESWLYTGKSAEEIAGSMGITVSTVRVQLKSALDKLRTQLGHLLFLIFFV